MKVAELVAAFQRFATTQNAAGETAPNAAPPQPAKPANNSLAPNPVAPDSRDLVTVSPEAVFTFAASLYNPERITRADVGALADTLLEGGAISHRDRAILASPPDGQTRNVLFERDPAVPTNLISEFQGRLSGNLANSNIGAVEEDTRALSILGRLASIREELP
jgi:hypothetical protein